VPRTFANAATGYIVEQTGWFWFFIVCTVLAIPGLMLLPKVAPWNESEPSRVEPPQSK
jgi:PAT family beta-lactamase induction signal transducer AmpG